MLTMVLVDEHIYIYSYGNHGSFVDVLHCFTYTKVMFHGYVKIPSGNLT